VRWPGIALDFFLLFLSVSLVRESFLAPFPAGILSCTHVTSADHSRDEPRYLARKLPHALGAGRRSARVSDPAKISTEGLPARWCENPFSHPSPQESFPAPTSPARIAAATSPDIWPASFRSLGAGRRSARVSDPAEISTEGLQPGFGPGNGKRFASKSELREGIRAPECALRRILGAHPKSQKGCDNSCGQRLVVGCLGLRAACPSRADSVRARKNCHTPQKGGERPLLPPNKTQTTIGPFPKGGPSP